MTTSPAPKKTRWGVVALGIVACAILLPLMIRVQQPQQEVFQLSKTSAESLEPMRRFYSANESPGTEQIAEQFGSISTELLAKCENVAKEVDEVERKRCSADPHLEKALDDPFNTPFFGPHSKLEAELMAELAKVTEALIADYEKNSKDSATVKAKIKPLMNDSLRMNEHSISKEECSKRLRAVESETKDPLFFYCLLFCSIDLDSWGQKLARAKGALAERTVDPFLKLAIRWTHYSHAKNLTPGELIDAKIDVVNSFVDLIRVHRDSPPARAFLMPKLQEFVEDSNDFVVIDLSQKLYALKQECPEWLLQYLASSLANKAAWRYRGHGYVSDISPENFALFEKYAEIEAKHLLRAWTLDPEVIALYSPLIRLESSAETTGRSADAWLRHALATQLDSEQTMRDYTHFCEPRWGGSDEKLLWLAMKIADCVGVESDLPFKYWHPLRTWCIEKAYASNTGIPDLLNPTLRIVDYLKKQPADKPSARIYTLRAAMITRVLWDAGQITELQWFLERYGKTFTDAHLVDHTLNKTMIEQICHAAQGEAIDCWQTLHTGLFIESDKLNPEKIKNLQLALDEAKSLADDETSKSAVATCEKMMRWAKSFHDGEDTRLDFDEKMTGWYVGTPFELGNLEGAPPEMQYADLKTRVKQNPVMLKPLLKFPLPYVVEAQVQCRSAVADVHGFAIQCGPFGYYASHSTGAEIRMNPIFNSVRIDSLPRPDLNGMGIQTIFFNVRGFNHMLKMEMRSTQASAFIDGTPVGTYETNMDTLGVVQFGRLSEGYGRGLENIKDNEMIYRVRDIRMKRLDDIGTSPFSDVSPFETSASESPDNPSNVIIEKD